MTILSYIFCCLLFPGTVKAQRCTGHWFGIGRIQTTGNYNNYLSEFILQQKGSQVTGELQYYFRDSLMKVSLKGNYSAATHRLIIQPFTMVYYLSPTAGNTIDCRLSGEFTLIASKAGIALNGRLFPDTDHRYTVPDILYRLNRSDDTLPLPPMPLVTLPDTAEMSVTNANADTLVQKRIPHVHEDSLPPVSPVFAARPKTYFKDIEVEHDSLRIELYDNGEIDFDSVSLYLNDRPVLPKSMLTHKAIRLNIYLDATKTDNELSMFAENLGLIPPNTAAIILYDGKIRHELIMTSDLDKTATIRIRRKKPAGQ